MLGEHRIGAGRTDEGWRLIRQAADRWDQRARYLLARRAKDEGDSGQVAHWSWKPGIPEAFLLRAKHLATRIPVEAGELYWLYGRCRMRGWECDRSEAEAIEAFKKAAQLGNQRALLELKESD